ncbi:MAG: acyltransferase family protein [Pseudomonadota bacterium]
MSDRKTTIDVAKGLGIILVVLGHNWLVVSPKEELFRVIFSFHMPLFFFLSGIFLKETESFKNFITSKSSALLKPYLVVLIVLAFFIVPMRSSSWLDYFAGMLYGTGATIEWSPLWFLPHLFLALLLTRIFLSLTHNTKILFLLSFILLIIGVSIIDLFWKMELPIWMKGYFQLGKSKDVPGLPFSIDVLAINTAFVLAGFLLRKQTINAHFQPFYFLTALIVFALAHINYDETMDVSQRIYGNLFITTLEAVCGIYLVISIAVLIDTITRLHVLGKTLSYLGASSLFILIFHAMIQRTAFKSLHDLTAMPYLSALIGLVVGIVVPLIILEIVKRQQYLSLLLLPQKPKVK